MTEYEFDGIRDCERHIRMDGRTDGRNCCSMYLACSVAQSLLDSFRVPLSLSSVLEGVCSVLSLIRRHEQNVAGQKDV